MSGGLRRKRAKRETDDEICGSPEADRQLRLATRRKPGTRPKNEPPRSGEREGATSVRAPGLAERAEPNAIVDAASQS